MSGLAAAALLAAVLAAALLRPRGMPEAAVAVPAAGLALLLGLMTPAAALARTVELGPTVAFLAAILLLGRLADVEGVFAWLGARLVAGSGGSPRRLLGLVFAAAAVVTAVLSLDATVVLLTPVVLAAARSLRVRARPHVYACTHLANSASLLLPVSNLTNLLAVAASGLTFVSFAALMVLPWLAVLTVEYAVLRWWFRRDLLRGAGPVAPSPAAPAVPVPAAGAPRSALTVLALTLGGFGVSSTAGVEPVWVALAGVVALAVRPLTAGSVTPLGVVRAADPLFCLFVLALGVVVEAVTENGLGDLLAAAVPDGTGFAALLGTAALAALCANLLNNVPATLVLLAVLGDAPAPGVVLALLIGVNVGPNLTFVGSLATMLWRRVLTASDEAPRAAEFHGLGAVTVPLALVAAVAALWAGLQLR